MARKATRSKRRTVKRAPVNEALVQQRRALEQTVRLERKVRALSREVRQAHARAKSALCSLAHMVFQDDADFREAIVENETSTRARDAMEREPALAGSSATE